MPLPPGIHDLAQSTRIPAFQHRALVLTFVVQWSSARCSYSCQLLLQHSLPLSQAVMALINDTTKVAPNPKMFLRTFWYRAIFKGVARADDMHVYILARYVEAL